MSNHTSNGIEPNTESLHDPFTGESRRPTSNHRYSSYLDAASFSSDVTASPSQARRTIQVHLAETERRLHETHKLGTTLLQQQNELTEKLREVEQQPDDTELPAELKQRLVDLSKEHDDVGKEIARAMLAPRSRVVSAEEVPESPAALASQATGSPSKVSVPSRRQRNQPNGSTDHVQFAADISTALLAQIRHLQSVLLDRDEALKSANAENSRLEHEAAGFSQRLRALDESEQRYKDENWNLETQKHELATAAKETSDREKRLNTLLAAALAEKTRAQSELDDVKVAHGKLTEDHAAAKKAHDSELHTLKRTVDMGDNDRADLLKQVDELTSQNRELALAVAGRSRQQAMPAEPDFGEDDEDLSKDTNTPEHSPPPSPTKATPRHGGLESETLKSSLHHAHRMIQNLKGNIHREKTEKIELKRMLQEARDELEQQRTGNGLGSGTKRQKTRSEMFKKPLQPNMLGKSRQSRTDFEMQDEDWEDNAGDSPSHVGIRPPGAFPLSRNVTDVSDAGNDTEGTFETADERQHTESEAFETGAESLAGESTDELTETEDTVGRTGTVKGPRGLSALHQIGNRSSYLSTASTSAGEEDDDLRTPIQAPTSRFQLKNGKNSLSRNSRAIAEASPIEAESSPATAINDRSPPAAEQSLFAELGDFDERSNYNTPGRSSIASANSTPFDRTRRSTTRDITPAPFVKAVTLDAGTSTDDLPSLPADHGFLGKAAAAVGLGGLGGYALGEHGQLAASPSDFPLLPSVSAAPVRHTDSGTQYTPSKSLQASPMRNLPTFITPPKTVWDEAQAEQSEDKRGDITPTPAMQQNALGFSNTLSQNTRPAELTTRQSLPAHPLAYSSIIALESEPTATNISSYADSPTLAASDPAMSSRPQTSSKDAAVAVGAGAGAGILATAVAAIGWSSVKGKRPAITEDETSQSYEADTTARNAGKTPLKDVTGNRQAFVEDATSLPMKMTTSNSRGVQTMLTSEHIEQALRKKQESIASTMAAATPVTPRPASQNRDRSQIGEAAPLIGATTPPKRPASSNSQRASSFTSQHPPLPSDHRTAIAKASGSSRVSSPISDPNNSSHVSTLMGPPIAPASAYRRSKTPTGQSMPALPASRDGATSRVSHRQRGAGSVSRRSSVSSFASELDERFNIRADQLASSHAHQFESGPGTDPRMIQAITQTMIGEYLWKYTRKPGRTDMSNTRHRRYFWVHPYTKTLYWSNQDPQTAGRNELKAKSVAIHSVRVVSDDNPMPPGLHRKSLEVITPGRKIKFTAPTGQRHETWFNALSYLLLRGDDVINQASGAYSTGGNEITNEDVSEFNAGYPTRPALTTSSSRMSMSSYNSRTTRGTSQNRTSVRQGVPTGYAISSSARRPQNEASTATRSSTIRQGNSETNHISTQAEANRERDRDSTVRGTSSSRFSRMMTSVTGRSRSDAGLMRSESPTKGPDEQPGSIYDASIVSDNRHDSAEALRQDLLKQERESDRLENVRACCDGNEKQCLLISTYANDGSAGKHDVSTLAAGGRHSHHHHGASSRSRSRHTSIDRLSRSVSKRPVGTITGPSAGTQGQGVVQMG
jgi:Meiotic cell cortex C-terminal pleckstrin homology